MTGFVLALAGASFAKPVPIIGSAYGGGYFAGQISTAGNGVADYNLVVAPVSSGQNSSKVWATSQVNVSGTSSVIDGPGNTAAMIAAGAAAHPAADFCDQLTIGGFSDWYLPARNELEVCYYNLKPTTSTNSTNSGTNTNAVPSRSSNYTSGTPSQTSASDFKDTGSEDFSTVSYKTSTQNDQFGAWLVSFNQGSQVAGNKTLPNYVRAIRRVAV